MSSVSRRGSTQHTPPSTGPAAAPPVKARSTEGKTNHASQGAPPATPKAQLNAAQLQSLEGRAGAAPVAKGNLMALRLDPAAAVGRKDRPGLDADVIIVGAGMSGLAAAKDLLAAGKSVKILEAQDRVGGRAHVDRENFSIPFDLGGAWIHGVDANPLTAMADAMGLTRKDTNGGPLYVDGKRATDKQLKAFEHTEEKFLATMKKLAQAGKDVSAAEALKGDASFSDVWASVKGPLESGAELKNTSVIEASGFRDDNDDLVKEGLGTLVEKFAEGIPVQTGTPVKKISYGKDGVTVETANGEILRSKKIIMTVSTGVLASGKIQFDPPLPEWKKEAIAGVPMGLLNKIVLEFKSDIFDKDIQDNAVIHYDHKGTTAQEETQNMDFLLKPMGANIAVGFVGGDFAKDVEKMGDAQAIDLAKSKLKKMFGDKVDTEYLKGGVTRWGSNPWTMGAYSAAMPGCAHMREKLGKPVDAQVYFAGEAVSRPEVNGSYAGAYESGKESAAAILKELSAEAALSS